MTMDQDFENSALTKDGAERGNRQGHAEQPKVVTREKPCQRQLRKVRNYFGNHGLAGQPSNARCSQVSN